MFRLLTAAVFAGALAVTAQRIDTRAVRVVRQTDSTATLVTSWVTSNADSVRLAYSTGTLRTRLASRRVDTLVVARLATAQTVSVSLTPIRRTTAGAARSASVIVPARVVAEPPPTVDSVRVDTLRPVVTPPVVTPPTPQPIGSFTPNLPSGLALVTDTRFQNQPTNGGLNAEGIGYAWDGRSATDASAPWGPSVLETFYPGNHAGNGEGGAVIYSRENYRWRSIYFAIAVWVPANYVTHTGDEKFYYPYIVNSAGDVTSGTIVGWSGPATAPTIGFNMQTQVGDANVIPPSGLATIRKGTWQTVEMYAVMNAPGQRNGVWRVWVDGRLAADFTNVRYSGQSAQGYFNGVRFDGTRGGGASSVLTPAGGQVRRYNRLAFYAAP